MTAKTTSELVLSGLVHLQNDLGEFEEVCMDENFTKLFNELNKRGQSTIHKSDYLDSLTSSIILKDILLYRPEQVVQLNHPMTNKEKLSLLYGLYHNYCLRQFDRLYNPKLAGGSFGDSQLWAGGTYYSQHPLMIECKNLIKISKASQQKKFYEGRYDELERIGERLHALKETIKHFSDTLSQDNGLNQLTRVVDEDNFNKKYFTKLTLDCNGVIPFKYVASDRKNLTPMSGAHTIAIDKLRKMIDLIFKIKRLKKNSSKKGRLYLLLLKLLFFYYHLNFHSQSCPICFRR